MPHRERYLFVCINRRPDDNPKGSCAQKGSEELVKKLKASGVAPDQIKTSSFQLERGDRNGTPRGYEVSNTIAVSSKRVAKPKFGSLPVLLVLGPEGSTKTTTIIRSGLEPSDRVIVDGIPTVRPGATVAPHAEPIKVAFNQDRG